MTSPYEIEVLLHYYACAGDYPKMDTPAFKAAVIKFENLGLIYKSNQLDTVVYKGNREALKVYAEALMAVPLPVQKWIIPDQNDNS